jgi:hypothetical protein
MKWIGLLVVAPVWGMLSTLLFLQAWLAVVNFCISLLGFARGRVPRVQGLLGMGAGLFGVLVFSLLLRAGFWILTEVMPFGRTGAENTVYWLCAVLSALFLVSQVPAKLRKSWRNAMVPGSLEEDIVRREQGRDPTYP